MIFSHTGKNRTILILALCALTLAGCGGKNSDTARTAETAAATAQTASSPAEYADPEKESVQALVTDGDYSRVKVGICVPQDADTELTDDITEYLTDRGVSEENITLDTASNTADRAEEMLRDGVSVLFVDAGSADNVSEIANAAVEQGTAVIFIGTAPSSDETDRWSEVKVMRAFYAGADTSQTESLQGEILAGLDLGEGKAGTLLIDTDQDALTRSAKEKGRETDVLDSEEAGLDADTAKQKVKDALKKYGDDLDVIVCGSDGEALAAVQAIQDADKTPGKDVFVIGAGASDDALNEINDGSLSGTVYADAYEQAQSAGKAAFSFLTGTGKSGSSLCDEVAVTQANVQEIIDYRQ